MVFSISIFIIGLFFNIICHTTHDVTVTNTTATKMGILVGFIQQRDTSIESVADILVRDLQTSGQFFVHKQKLVSAPKCTKDITSFFAQGYHFVLIINAGRKKKTIEYRLFDSLTGAMIKQASGAYHKKVKAIQGWAHHIADIVWSVLTGKKVCFLLKLRIAKR